MNISFGTVVGFVAFLAIALVVFVVFWRKAKKEVPQDVAAKMEYIENRVENNLREIKDYMKK